MDYTRRFCQWSSYFRKYRIPRLWLKSIRCIEDCALANDELIPKRKWVEGKRFQCSASKASFCDNRDLGFALKARPRKEITALCKNCAKEFNIKVLCWSQQREPKSDKALTRTRIITKYLIEDYYVIRLVDSVWVPSTCSFLRCSATCSAVGKEWSHFGHVKPVSDIMFDWTILNKNMYQAAIALHKCARCMCLPFSLCIITRINIVGTGLAIKVNGNAYSKKLWLGWMHSSLCMARLNVWCLSSR